MKVTQTRYIPHFEVDIYRKGKMEGSPFPFPGRAVIWPCPAQFTFIKEKNKWRYIQYVTLEYISWDSGLAIFSCSDTKRPPAEAATAHSTVGLWPHTSLTYKCYCRSANLFTGRYKILWIICQRFWILTWYYGWEDESVLNVIWETFRVSGKSKFLVELLTCDKNSKRNCKPVMKLLLIFFLR